MCKTVNAVHVDVWSHGKGCEKKKEKRFHKRTISIVISINHPTPFPLYHGGGMNLRVRPREYNINFVGSE